MSNFGEAWKKDATEVGIALILCVTAGIYIPLCGYRHLKQVEYRHLERLECLKHNSAIDCNKLRYGK